MALGKRINALTSLGDFSAAMKGIKAKALVLPCQTDLYFRKSFSSQLLPVC